MVDPLLIDYHDREWGVPRLVARHSAIALARFRLPLTWKKKCVRNSYPYVPQKVVMRCDEAFIEKGNNIDKERHDHENRNRSV
jgi:hypothetical protein